MVDNSLIQTAAGNETFANKDIGGIKHPKHISVDSTGLEVVPATHADMLTLLSKDFATQTTLASILAKLIASPATEATLASANSTLSSILSKLISAPATEGTLLTASTTLTSILNKLIAAPATEASLVAETPPSLRSWQSSSLRLRLNRRSLQPTPTCPRSCLRSRPSAPRPSGLTTVAPTLFASTKAASSPGSTWMAHPAPLPARARVRRCRQHGDVPIVLQGDRERHRFQHQ